MPAEYDEKTEAPTPRRREEARRKGQVARSQDATAATLLLTGFVALALLGPALWHTLLGMVRAALSTEAPADLARLWSFTLGALREVGIRLGPILLILFVAILATLLAQVGLLFTWQPLMPSLTRLNPINGLKRLFSVRSLMLAFINFGKLLVVGAVAYVVIRDSAAAIIFAGAFEHLDVLRLGSGLLLSLGLKLAVALLVLALLDVAWQRYKHERDLKMTKEEVKDEMRSMDGDPQVKKRRRQLQMQLSVQRLRRDVPEADVVVTNPTHVAVALCYNADTMVAPKVVAKGGDYLALRIRQVAAAAGVPIVERRALARGLYETVDVGKEIPERFYRAVAEILAYVYELSGAHVRSGTRVAAGAA